MLQAGSLSHDRFPQLASLSLIFPDSSGRLHHSSAESREAPALAGQEIEVWTRQKYS